MNPCAEYRYADIQKMTPPEIVKALGPFDLDPCAPIKRPWPTTANHYTIEDNGLIGRTNMRAEFTFSSLVCKLKTTSDL